MTLGEVRRYDMARFVTLTVVRVVLLLFAVGGPAAAQEIRPTLDKFKETGVVHLGHREASRPFSFFGSDGQPAGYSVDLCLQIVEAVRQSLKLPGLKVAWVAVTPGDRIPKLVKGIIDLECGIATIKDLPGKRVGVIPNTTTEKVLAPALASASVQTTVVTVNDHGLLDAEVDDEASDGRRYVPPLMPGRRPGRIVGAGGWHAGAPEACPCPECSPRIHSSSRPRGS
jgi:ABC-type amino acid transport substrate-binding protein